VKAVELLIIMLNLDIQYNVSRMDSFPMCNKRFVRTIGSVPLLAVITVTRERISRINRAMIDRHLWMLSTIVGLILFWFLRQRGYDDPYITYRYAMNLASGNGFVYNPGVATLSTTAPLFGLILTPVASFGWPIPLVANLIGCLSHATGALALWRLGQEWNDRLAAGAAALLYLLFPFSLTTLGSETLPAMALTLWIFVWAARVGNGLPVPLPGCWSGYGPMGFSSGR
jgi:hypothetical protein